MPIIRRVRRPRQAPRITMAPLLTRVIESGLGKVEAQAYQSLVFVPTQMVSGAVGRFELQGLSSLIFRYPIQISGSVGRVEMRAPGSGNIPKSISGALGLVEFRAPASDVTVATWTIDGGVGATEVRGLASNIKILPKQVLSTIIGQYEARPRVSNVVIPYKVVDSDVGMMEVRALASDVAAAVSILSGVGRVETQGAGQGNVRILEIEPVEGRIDTKALQISSGQVRGTTSTRWTERERDTGTWSEY